jgi:hypothetical protein
LQRRHGPDEQLIKVLLLDCLEEHYGDLSSAVARPDRAVTGLREIAAVLDRFQDLLK